MHYYCEYKWRELDKKSIGKSDIIGPPIYSVDIIKTKLLYGRLNIF